MKTYFEIKKTTENYYNIIQRNRSAYYEDTLNELKCVDRITCSTKSIEIAEKLIQIFNEIPLTSEFLQKRRSFFRQRLTVTSKGEFVFDSLYHGKCSNFYSCYELTESKVRCEEDLYNGTDQSVTLLYLTLNKNKFIKQEVCSMISTHYVPDAIVEFCCKHKIGNPFNF